jgi:RNA polymerase sigma-70 factor (ECF subfamily)
MTPDELLVLAGDGDDLALAGLFDRLGGAVLALAWRSLRNLAWAEEATVLTFRTAWRAAATFDPEHADAIAWIHDIAQGVLRDAGAPTPADAIADELELLRVHVAVASLPRKERLVIEGTYARGLSPQAIAASTGWPLGTVKTRTRNAFANLADGLADVSRRL